MNACVWLEKPFPLRPVMATRSCAQAAGRVRLALQFAALVVMATCLPAASPASDLLGGDEVCLTQPFPDELEFWPDLKRVDRVLNRKPFQSFTSYQSLVWLDGGKTIVGGVRAGYVVWDVASGQQKQRLPTRARNGGEIRASRDGRRILTTGDGTNTQILDWPSLEVTQSIEAHKIGPRSHGTMSGVRLSPDGKYAAMIIGATTEIYLRIFDCNSGRMVLHQELERGISSMTWDPQNRFLVVGERRGTVIFLSLRGQLLRRGIRLDPPERPWSLAMSPDGERLAVCTEHSVGMYAIHGRRKIWELGRDDFQQYARIMKVQFSKYGGKLIGLRERYPNTTELVAWDAKTGRETRSRKIGTYYTSMMELSPDGQRIASTGDNNTLLLCDAKTFEPMVVSEPAGDHSIVNGHNFPAAVYPSPDGTRLVSIGWTAVTMWDVDSGEELWTISRPEPMHSAAWNSSGEWFASVRGGTHDYDPGPTSLEVLNAQDGRLKWRFPLEDSSGGSAQVLSDDRIVVCTGQHARLFHPSGRLLWKTHLGDGDRSVSLCVSADENLVAIVRRNGRSRDWYSHRHIVLLDTQTGKLLRELRGVTTPVRATFSADGTRLFASSTTSKDRGHVQLLMEQWDVETGTRINNPHVPDDPKHGVDFVRGPGDDEIQAIVDRSPLLAGFYSRAPGRMAVSADRKWLVLERPFETGYLDERNLPKWSKRLMIWDMQRETSPGELVMPGWMRDVAVFRGGRLAVQNANGTIFLMSPPPGVGGLRAGDERLEIDIHHGFPEQRRP